MACLTSMIEPLRAANEISGHVSFTWKLVSETGEKVIASAEVAFEPDVALSDRLDVDILFILSSPSGQFNDPKVANGSLRRLDRAGVTMGAISGGVFPLVRAGLMAGHQCSVHWCYATAFREEFPEVAADEAVIVRDGRRYTVSGAAAAFDLSLQLIEARLGADTAHEVACWFQHPSMRGEGVRQRIPTHTAGVDALPDLVAKAAILFSQNIAEPISVGEVAKQLNVTPRQIERAFKKATGQSPSHYYREIRMKAARQLVIYSKESFLNVALAVGYGSSTLLGKHYRGAFGMTPQEDRDRVNSFRVQGNIPLPSA